MIVHLAERFSEQYHILNVVQYITFRAILAAITALLVALWFGPHFIRWLHQKQLGQQIRSDGPKSHYSKAGIPTMGGAIILVALAVSLLLWGDLKNMHLWLMLVCTLGFGAIGWVDDYRKVIRKNTRGLPGRWKYFWQSLVAVAILAILAMIDSNVTTLYFPFFKEMHLDMGLFYFVFAYFVLVGSSNAVNLTDGLDGLATMPTVLVSAGLGVFAYVAGHADFASYLCIPFIHGVGEVAVFAAALCGAGLGFLWYNSYPAQVFMGDVGSLALGAALGLMAVLVHQECILFFMGGIFVLETVSVILQVGSFKLTGKRIFKMAPIHHHFELQGLPEPKIVVRFWIITVILVLLGLSTLKLR